jgi:hypothetical protein
MTQWAAETSAFRLSRQAADCLKIELIIKLFIYLFSVFRKIILFSELNFV